MAGAVQSMAGAAQRMAGAAQRMAGAAQRMAGAARPRAINMSAAPLTAIRSNHAYNRALKG
jgi:hypothetical protein